MRTIDSPCKDCPIRYGGCHSVCILYQRYKEDKVTLANVKKGKNILDDYFTKAVKRSIALGGR